MTPKALKTVLREALKDEISLLCKNMRMVPGSVFTIEIFVLYLGVLPASGLSAAYREFSR